MHHVPTVAITKLHTGKMVSALARDGNAEFVASQQEIERIPLVPYLSAVGTGDVV